ncbi:acryloyl-CoA reductase [Halobacillus litoralis]|uniref:acrylyl-CoA reductase family protein n=1 Tax=Halobacillus litoralis TaxID=45668 RepID=UPI001CD32C27|nr:acryloyl-CoA reductase [Halobacillus litoralis]MCA0970767.1 acryloyl-CoA reductase [Halobacillus litoralis]
MKLPEQFQALVVDEKGDGVEASLQTLTFDDLPDGDVTIKVHYSSVNYKDGLASIKGGNIVKEYPFVPGIDLAGEVVQSEDDRYNEGDHVIVTSYELGVSHYGGYSEYARVPGEWIVPLPEGLTMKEAMTFGTAGFTAALSIDKMERNGQEPSQGKVLVSGATGGVGSMAVAMLAQKGYEVAASTGKPEENYLTQLGASEVLSREDVTPEKIRSLGKQKWAGAVDPVGGETLAAILSNTQYDGNVAVSGLTAGVKVPTTVFPFILRSVNLLGIDSVYYPQEKRVKLWERLASDLKPETLLEEMTETITMSELPDKLSEILRSQTRGRTVVQIGS